MAPGGAPILKHINQKPIIACSNFKNSKVLNSNKPRTAESAPPVRNKILIGRELLKFENFQFSEDIFINNAYNKKAGAFSKTFFFWKLLDYPYGGGGSSSW